MFEFGYERNACLLLILGNTRPNQEQEGWYLVFEYVYYWPAEVLPDPLDAEVTIRKLLFEEMNHLYHTSDPKMKNSVQGLINEGIIFRYFYRNEDLEWGIHVDFSLRDVIPQRS